MSRATPSIRIDNPAHGATPRQAECDRDGDGKINADEYKAFQIYKEENPNWRDIL